MSIQIDKDHLRDICKMGQGKECCRYILLGRDGFTCGKHDADFRVLLDDRVQKGTLGAIGDNCEGLKP